MKQLLERPEINLNGKNTHAHVPLHLAAQNGHLELSRILASKEGTNLDSKDLIGEFQEHIFILLRCVLVLLFIFGKEIIISKYSYSAYR